jgi:hypothetical protein
MAPEAQELIIVVEEIIDTRRDAPCVCSTWIATEALVKLDPGPVSLAVCLSWIPFATSADRAPNCDRI